MKEFILWAVTCAVFGVAGFWLCTITFVPGKMAGEYLKTDSIIKSQQQFEDSINLILVDKEMTIKSLEKLDSIKTKIYENKSDSMLNLPDSIKYVIYCKRAADYQKRYLQRYYIR